MEYIYSCEKFNPSYNYDNFVIVDESDSILSPAYLHSFNKEGSNEKYGVISDNIGNTLPYLFNDNELIFGTSRHIYFFDVVSKVITQKLLNSPCAMLAILHNQVIVICECDVMIISLLNKHVIALYEFNDVITDYVVYENYLIIQLMEGTEKKIKIQEEFFSVFGNA